MQNKPNSSTSSYISANRLSYSLPIVGAIIIPFFIGFIDQTYLLSFISYAFFVVPLIMVYWNYYQWLSDGYSLTRCLFRYVKPLPAWAIYGTDIEEKGFPYITIILIIINTSVYFILPDNIVERYVFFPHGDPSLLQIIFSVFSSTFLHSDVEHLSYNMLFLLIFGSTIEPRIGVKRFLSVYFVCVVISKLFVVVLLICRNANTQEIIKITDFHSLGASGGISGLMGLFIVRFFFATIKSSIPVFYLPIFNIPIITIPFRANVIIIAGLYFTLELRGSVDQFFGQNHHVNYWAHVGGYVSGFVLAYFMNLQKDAADESVSVKAKRSGQKQFNKQETIQLYNEILQKDIENEEALSFFLKHYIMIVQEKAEPYYLRLMQIYLKKDKNKAFELFNEYFPIFIRSISGDTLLRFGSQYYSRFDYNKAKHCFEIAAENRSPWQAKSMILYANTLEAMENFEGAANKFIEIIEMFPDSPFERVAKEKLIMVS